MTESSNYFKDVNSMDTTNYDDRSISSCSTTTSCSSINKCIDICSGKMLYTIHHIFECYCLIQSIFSEYNRKINELLLILDDPDLNNIYINLLKCLRCEIEKVINDDCKKKKQLCIVNKEIIIVVECNTKNFGFKLAPFIPLNFLQRIDKNCKLLYFENDPNITPYNNNPKVIYEKLTNKTILYPVWYFVYDNKISSDYDYIISLIGESLTYNDILENRLLLKDEIKMDSRKTINALGKYKFIYCVDKCELILKDPFNPSEDISPYIQGVIDGLYSFEDDLSKYITEEELSIVINNTIKVINKLIECLNKFNGELCDFKKRICYCSIGCEKCNNRKPCNHKQPCNECKKPCNECNKNKTPCNVCK